VRPSGGASHLNPSRPLTALGLRQRFIVQELYEYVEQTVAAKSRAEGGNQQPVMKGEMEGALLLVRVR
jgi:hypothetical protein